MLAVHAGADLEAADVEPDWPISSVPRTKAYPPVQCFGLLGGFRSRSSVRPVWTHWAGTTRSSATGAFRQKGPGWMIAKESQRDPGCRRNKKAPLRTSPSGLHSQAAQSLRSAHVIDRKRWKLHIMGANRRDGDSQQHAQMLRA